MTPAPSLQDLIEMVRTDSTDADPLTELGQAALTVGEIEEVSDALLGYFVDRCRRSGRSWSDISSVLGVSKQAAHKRFSTPLSANPPTFERFTDRARAVLRGSADQAQRLGQSYVGTEHLLLAMFQPSESLAAQVLAEFGVNLGDVEILVFSGQLPDRPTRSETPFNQGAADVLRHAVMEALKLGHNYIGTEHLLLALFDDAKSPAAKALQTLGLTYEDTAARLEVKFAAIRATRG